MDKIYSREYEDNDYELLQDFNSVLKLRDLGRCPENDSTDASGYTTDGRYLNIELKRRNIDINRYKTIYIESHKCGDMLLDYVVEKKIPLYVNFLSDGHVVVYNLAELKHRPNKVAKRIYSKLYEGFELAKREELQLDDAWIYQKTNNGYKLVHKP